jgi:hypothetical protein
MIERVWPWVKRVFSYLVWLLLMAMNLWNLSQPRPDYGPMEPGTDWRVAMLPLAPWVVLFVIGLAAIHAAERWLKGGALVAARCAVAGLATFVVLVAGPMTAAYGAGRSLLGPDTLTGLALWLGIVVPATGVLIAYRLIGDGSPRPTRGIVER